MRLSTSLCIIALFALARVAIAFDSSRDVEDPPITFWFDGNASAHASSATVSEVATEKVTILNTGPPPPFGRAAGTAIFDRQRAAIRFTAIPGDVYSKFASLSMVWGSPARSCSARISIVEDSGRNSPDLNRVIDSRVITVPAGTGRATVTAYASKRGSLLFWPGEIFWIVVEGDSKRPELSFSWLDSEKGVAWTGFFADDFNAGREKNMDQDEFNDAGGEIALSSAAGWVITRSKTASSASLNIDY